MSKRTPLSSRPQQNHYHQPFQPPKILVAINTMLI